MAFIKYEEKIKKLNLLNNNLIKLNNNLINLVEKISLENDGLKKENKELNKNITLFIEDVKTSKIEMVNSLLNLLKCRADKEGKIDLYDIEEFKKEFYERIGLK